MTIVWFEGRLRDAEEPLVGALDHGITVGDGVFETMLVLDGRAFALTRHLARLARSATGLGLLPPDEDKIRDGVSAVLAVAPPETGRLRVTVTGGPGPLGSGRDGLAQTVLVAAGPATVARASRAARVSWVRNERSAVAGLKTTSYAENVVALAAAAEYGADEALLANTRGELCEGTGSNIVVERDDELLTPPLDSGCLAGITRELLLEWGAAAGLPVREATLPFEVLDDVVQGRAHAALTSSTRNVSLLAALDGQDVSAGELCLAAQELFARKQTEDLDP